jgi:DNA repair protein RadB
VVHTGASPSSPISVSVAASPSAIVGRLVAGRRPRNWRFLTERGERSDVSEPIPTGCDTVDDLLDGGFERGAVTQIYGPPAAGKTNLALSAAIEVAADGGTALYIDTEGISVDRFEQLARAKADDESVEDIASRVIITDALDFDEQQEAVKDAADFAERADLVVLDSATGFYRLERHDDDEGDTLRQVASQVTHLLSLARRHDLAVVITNQVYSDPESDSSRARPLGGHTLTHWSGTVLRLERFRAGNRRATLEKHRAKAAGETARFRITETGLEGVDEEV